MAHPHHAEHKQHKESRVSRILGEKADKRSDEKLIREAFAEHDKQLHGGKKTNLKFRAAGGAVDGDKPKSRLDKGGRKGNTVNVTVVSGGQKPSMPMPMGAGTGAGPMPPVPPPGPAAGLPPGLPMRKRGGGVYKAGAGDGEGRIEKIKAYGHKAREVKPESRKRGGKA